MRWQLAPLEPAETRAYVRHRIAVAAGEPKELFSEAALREIHRRTGGVPRLVNQLCDRALLGGYAARKAQVGPALVRAAAREIPDARRPHEAGGRIRSARPWLLFAGVCLLVGLGLVAGLQVGRTRLTQALQASVLKDPTLEERAAGSVGAMGEPAVGAPPPTLAKLVGAIRPEERGDAANPGAGGWGEAGETRAGVVALAPGLLARMLEARDPRAALGTTERALLESFGRRVPALAPKPGNAEALEASLRARGLEATAFDGGSLGLLRRLDHPVALALSPDLALEPAALSSGQVAAPARWLAVLGFEGDRARVAGLIESREVTVPIDELEQHWTDTGIVVWERFEEIPPSLARNDEGGAVIWLQRALAELRYHSEAPTGLFDAETAEALSEFQRDRGLTADGVAGPLTLVALYGQLERYPVPRLSESTQARVQVSPAPATDAGGPSPLAPDDATRPAPRLRTGGERG